MAYFLGSFARNIYDKYTTILAFDQDVSIDTVLLNNDGLISYRGIKDELGLMHGVSGSTSTIFHYCPSLGMHGESSYIKPLLTE